jgi:predicted phosphodiesterase
MKPIRADLSADHKSIELLVLADYHYADPHSDHDAIRRDIDYVNTHDNAYCVLAGDLLDCALKSSLGDAYTNLSPMEELTAMMDLIEPLAKKGKVLCAVGGNHEARHYRTNGVDMTRLLMRQLGIEDKYSPDTALLFLRVGRDSKSNGHHRPILYTIYLTHGSGGGRKEGGKIQRLADYAQIVDADIYICGHTHLPASFKTGFARPSASNSSITYCTKLFVNSAAKLTYGGYGDTGGFKPPCIDTPRIVLSGENKDMRALI